MIINYENDKTELDRRIRDAQRGYNVALQAKVSQKVVDDRKSRLDSLIAQKEEGQKKRYRRKGLECPRCQSTKWRIYDTTSFIYDVDEEDYVNDKTGGFECGECAGCGYKPKGNHGEAIRRMFEAEFTQDGKEIARSTHGRGY